VEGEAQLRHPFHCGEVLRGEEGSTQRNRGFVEISMVKSWENHGKMMFTLVMNQEKCCFMKLYWGFMGYLTGITIKSCGYKLYIYKMKAEGITISKL